MIDGSPPRRCWGTYEQYETAWAARGRGRAVEAVSCAIVAIARHEDPYYSARDGGGWVPIVTVIIERLNADITRNFEGAQEALITWMCTKDDDKGGRFHLAFPAPSQR